MTWPAWQRKLYPAGERVCAWCREVRWIKAGNRACSASCRGHLGAMQIPDELLAQRAKRAAMAAADRRREDAMARHARAEAKTAGETPLEAYRRGYKNGLAAYRAALARRRQERSA